MKEQIKNHNEPADKTLKVSAYVRRKLNQIKADLGYERQDQVILELILEHEELKEARKMLEAVRDV